LVRLGVQPLDDGGHDPTVASGRSATAYAIWGEVPTACEMFDSTLVGGWKVTRGSAVGLR
jgi:hypothetical protein